MKSMWEFSDNLCFLSEIGSKMIKRVKKGGDGRGEEESWARAKETDALEKCKSTATGFKGPRGAHGHKLELDCSAWHVLFCGHI